MKTGKRLHILYSQTTRAEGFLNTFELHSHNIRFGKKKVDGSGDGSCCSESHEAYQRDQLEHACKSILSDVHHDIKHNILHVLSIQRQHM